MFPKISFLIAFPIFLKAILAIPLNLSISEHPVFLVIAFDGFRYDYFNKDKTPTLNSLRSLGVRTPYMTPVFPTLTFPNLHSIATGLYPELHGVVDNHVFDPKLNKSINGFCDEPDFWQYSDDVVPLWILNEMAGRGRISGCMMWPGSSYSYGKDNLFPTYFHPEPPTFNCSISWNYRVETVISWITNPSLPANLVFLYYEEPDSTSHEFGPDSPETHEEISKIDQKVEVLVEKLKEAGIFEKVNLLFLSDHGVTETSRKKVVNLTELADPKLIERKSGRSPVIQFEAKEGKESELFKKLEDAGEKYHFKAWKKEEMKGPFYYAGSERILDYVVVAEMGWVFEDFYKEMDKHDKKWNWTASADREYGVHGYSNQEPNMRPFFFAFGPAFKKDFDHDPIKNLDLFPLICEIIGIPERPNNGSFAKVVGMINTKLKKAQVP